jgi:hypothetical protein
VDDLLLAITHHLDEEASERKVIRNRLLSIEGAMERLASRGLRYLVALCIGVAAILAWQSYGEATKQIIATRAPELGWSPGAKQKISGWMQQLGWTKPLAENTAVRPPAPQTVASTSKAPAASSPDPQQVQQIEADIAAVRQAVERLAAGQDQMALEMRREMARLESDLVNILVKIPEPPPQRRGRR